MVGQKSYGAVDPESAGSIDEDSEMGALNDESLGSRTTTKRPWQICHPNTLGATSLFASLVCTFLILGRDGTTGFLPTNYGNIFAVKSWGKATKSSSSSSGPNYYFTMARVGYSSLPYFGPTESSDPANMVGKRGGMMEYKFLDDFAGIIEPAVNNHLIVFDGSDRINSTSKFRYSICPDDSNSQLVCQYGLKNDMNPNHASSVSIKCSPHDVFTLQVTEMKQDGSRIEQDPVKLLCMYVRREIRSLSSSDLSSTMDAMAKLWTVTTADGQRKYGSDYLDSSYMLALHHYNAAQQDADHIHEGNGFLAQHVKLTNLMESSVQVVDRGVTIPYWDFTIEDSEGKRVYDSVIMTPEVFGSMSKPSDLTWGYTYSEDSILDAAIPDGRWANLKAEMNTQYSFLSGYGFMRAPWSMNPSPYISRFTNDLADWHMPKCSWHYNMLQSSSLMDFMSNVEGRYSHATAHAIIGGVYGCDQLNTMFEQGYIVDEDSVKTVCSKWIFYLKEYYRLNLVSFGKSCAVNSEELTESSCDLTCNDKDGILKVMKSRLDKFVPEDMAEDGWNAWLEFLCEGGGAKIFPGDQLESASPADPSFWVIHPTLERLLQAKFMAGGFDDEKWSGEVEEAQDGSKGDSTSSSSSSAAVCQRAQCYSAAEGSLDFHESCCSGHRSGDRLLNFQAGDTGESFIGPTNAVTIKASDPRSPDYAMPYIYDNFDWSHCEEDFSGLLATQRAAKKAVFDAIDADVQARKAAVAAAIAAATQNSTVSSSSTTGEDASLGRDRVWSKGGDGSVGKKLKSSDWRFYVPKEGSATASKPSNSPTTRSPSYTTRPTHKPTYKPTISGQPTPDDDFMW